MSERLLEQIKKELTDPIVTQVSSQALLLVLWVVLSLPQLELLTREPLVLVLPLQRDTVIHVYLLQSCRSTVQQRTTDICIFNVYYIK